MRTSIKVNQSIVLTNLKFRYAHDITDGMQDDSIHKNTLTIPNPYALQNALDYIQLIKNFETTHDCPKDWAIIEQGRMIGGIGFLYDHGVQAHLTEIGYWLHRDWRGQKIMSQVLIALTHYAFSNTSLTKLMASVFQHNVASAKALKRAGFEQEGIEQRQYLKGEEYLDAIRYVKLK